MVNNEEPEEKNKPVQAKFLSETSREHLQRQPEADEKEKEKEEKPIQAKSAGSKFSTFEAGGDIETQLSQSKGRGSPLPDPVRTYMEPRFGVDFSDVRVHTGTDAIQMNRNVGAQAFTYGSNVFFGEGRSPTNLELTAHELTHVVQQTGGSPLRTKRDEEVATLGPEPSIQRICDACAVEDREEKGADPISHEIGNQAVQQLLLQANAEGLKEGSTTATSSATNTKNGNRPNVQRQEDELTVSGEQATATQAEEPSSHEVASADKQNELVTDAPSASYIVPFDRHPLAAPGERVIFRGDFTDPSPASYQLEYSTTGGHFTSATGPTTRTIAGLVSGNVDFFVPTPWNGTSAVQVVLKVKKISDNSIAKTETWDFGLKTRYPTTMTQREGTGETNLPGVYTYDIGPVVIPYVPPYYQHQTILERFGNWSLANIVPADISAAYRTAHSLNTAAAVSQHFLGNYAGNNGTFTVDANDQIADQHGGHPDLSNLVSNLATPKDIEVALPQTYEARPGTALGNYTVTRVLKADGTTWKVKKG
jgi:hypothetical protein